MLSEGQVNKFNNTTMTVENSRITQKQVTRVTWSQEKKTSGFEVRA